MLAENKTPDRCVVIADNPSSSRVAQTYFASPIPPRFHGAEASKLWAVVAVTDDHLLILAAAYSAPRSTTRPIEASGTVPPA